MQKNRFKTSLLTYAQIKTVKQFLFYFVPSSFIIIFLISYRVYEGKKEIHRDIKQEAKHHIEHHKEIIVYRLRNILLDTIGQAGHGDFKFVLDSRKKFHIEQLKAEFLDFVRNKKIYDQIRYLDENGMEIIRINYNNGNPQIVPDDELQNKSDRYYFHESNILKKGQVYISPFDLNIEKKEIERPFKPMIRFATPLFDSGGSRRGIVVINYLGEEILNVLRSTTHKNYGNSYLIDNRGYFFMGPKPEAEWGFMFEDKKDVTFEHYFPAAWKTISQEKSGQISAKDGLFIFDSLLVSDDLMAPASFMHAAIETGGSKPIWKIVSHIPTETLNETEWTYLKKHFLILFVLLSLSGIGSIMMTTLKQKQQESWMETKKLAVAVSQSPASVLITDTKGDIEYINPAFTTVTGYTREEVIGKNPRILKSDKHPDRYYKAIWDAISQGREWKGQLCNKKKNGELFWESSFISPIKNSEGEIVNYIAVKQDVTDRKKAEEILRDMSYTDGLTGLTNRRQFDTNLEVEVRRSHRSGSSLSLLMIDVDSFKPYNDCYGHQMGDECLKRISAVFKELARRPGDTAARYGGEEFAMILPDMPYLEARNFAEQIRKQIEDLKIPHKKSKVSNYVTVSIGVGCISEKSDTTSDACSLIQEADKALYAAKKGGRNQVAG